MFGKGLQDNCMHKLLAWWHTPVPASLSNIVLGEVNSYCITSSEFLSNAELGKGIGAEHRKTQGNAIFLFLNIVLFYVCVLDVRM